MCHSCTIGCQNEDRGQSLIWRNDGTQCDEKICNVCANAEPSIARCPRHVFETKVRAFEDGGRSDATIISCDNVQFKVHLFVVEQLSHHFATMFRDDRFKEGQTKTAYLEEAGFEIHEMLKYLYTEDYLNLTRAANSSETDATNEIMFHLQMARMGDKYMIPDLFEAAAAAFKANFLALVPFAHPDNANIEDREYPDDTLMVLRPNRGVVDLGRLTIAFYEMELGTDAWQAIIDAVQLWYHGALNHLKEYRQFQAYMKTVPELATDILFHVLGTESGRTDKWVCNGCADVEGKLITCITYQCRDCCNENIPDVKVMAIDAQQPAEFT